MTAKEQKIKEAYGELFEICKPNENGWTKWKVISHGETNRLHPNHDFDMDEHSFETKNNYGDGKFEWRPKSLQGIENNNGWIKIESEADLPKENGRYYVISSLDENIAEYDFPNPNFNLEFNNQWWLKYVTHYQPIIKPILPIY